MNNYSPLKNMVLIKEVLTESKTGDIIIPDVVSGKPSKKIVEAIGPDCNDVSVGDEVIASQYVGTDIMPGLKLICENEISAIIS